MALDCIRSAPCNSRRLDKKFKAIAGGEVMAQQAQEGGLGDANG